MRKIKCNLLIVFSICFIFVISVLKSIYVFNFKYKNDTYNIRRNCIVISKEKVSEDKITYLVKYDSNKFLLNIKMENIDSYYDDNGKVKNDSKIEEFFSKNEFSYGDVLDFRANIYIPSKLKNPYEFDYKRYLNSNDIVGIFTTNKAEKIGRKVDNIFLYIGSYIKKFINKRVDDNLYDKEARLYKSMLYGDDIYLDDDVKENFSKNGISHILATSGMHMCYLMMILNYATKNLNDKMSFGIKTIFIVFFCIISNLSISIIRAGIMAVIGGIGQISNEKVSSFKRLFISFIILMCINPCYIFNTSFVLSYLSTLGIITLYNLIYTYFSVKTCSISKKLEKLLSPIYNILSLSFSSLIFIFPMQVYYFGYINIFSFISNILITPIITVEFFIGFISIFFSFIPLISDIVMISNYVVLKIIIIIVEFLAKFDYFSLYIPRFSNFEIFIYYLVLLILNIKKYIPLYIKKEYRKILRKAIYTVTVMSYLYIISMYMYRVYFEEYVYFFNVEQGNMAIIRENRKVIVIDIGSTTKNLSYNVIKSFLNAKAIFNIDLVLLTHMHEDHVNGIYEISEDFCVKNIVMACPPEQSEEYYKINKLISDKNIGKIEVNFQDEIKYDEIVIKVLTSKENEVIYSSDMANSNSTVFLISIKNNNYLFMGDATIETERWILDNISNDDMKKIKNLTAIQIGHHGSKTSSSEKFISSIKSCIAIISAKKEKYGHPSKETLDILNKYNFKVKITQIEGAIKL